MSYQVVINCCYGGFSLSKKAMDLLLEKYNLDNSSIKLKVESISRHDPALVEVVKELGEEANGASSKLEIVDIKSSIYRISNYDGLETIYEQYEDGEWKSVFETNNLEFRK